MKKNVKGKRCALEQDGGVIDNIVNLLEEDEEFVKKTKIILTKDVDVFKRKEEKAVVKSESMSKKVKK